jgi:hypothetical protein
MTMPTTATTPAFAAYSLAPRLFIYAGRRVSASGMDCALVLLPDGDTATVDAGQLPMRWWAYTGNVRKALGHLRVGCVVSMDAREDDAGALTVRFSSMRVVEREWRQHDVVLELTALDREARMEFERRKNMKGRDALHEQLEPVRLMYARLRGARRVAVLAEVVRYITSGTDY